MSLSVLFGAKKKKNVIYEQAAKLIVAVSRRTDRSQTNVRSKLYFLGNLISDGNEKVNKVLAVSSRPRPSRLSEEA